MSTGGPQFPPPPSPPPLLPVQPQETRCRPNSMRSTATWNSICVEKEIETLSTRLYQDLHLESKQKVCFMYQCKPATPIIQEGPQCGLVGLAMACELLLDQKPDVHQIFTSAKQKGYTLQGEIFEADAIWDLAESFGCIGTLVQDLRSEAAISSIVAALMSQAVVLIPYDKDANGAPCRKMGEKAHWALLTGILLTTPNSRVINTRNKFATQHQNVPYLYQMYQNLTQTQMNTIMSDAEELTGSQCQQQNRWYVCAQHGNSKHYSLWSLRHLVDSNLNMYCLDDKIASNIQEYVVDNPKDPLNGLRGKAVILHRW